MLKKLKHECEIVNNGQEALDLIESKGIDFYDIILMDMQMPILDGISTTKILKEKYGSSTPYIVAMTANVFETDKKLCLSAGMNDFITKPVKLDYLEKSLRDAFLQKKAS